MADKFKKDESFIKKAAIGTPAVAGVGIGVSRMVKDLQAASESGVRLASSGPVAAINAISTATELSESMVQRSELARTERIAYMSRNWDRFKTPEGMRILKRSWSEAMRFADPISRDRLLTFTGRVSAMEDPAQVFSAIQRTFEANNSSLMSKVFGRLETNVAAFEGHRTLGLGLEVGSFTGFQSVKEPRVPPRQLPKGLQGYISRIQEALGGTTSISKYTREGVFAENYEMYRFGFGTKAGQNIDLMVPLTQKGTFLEGTSFRTRYISPQVGVAKRVGDRIQVQKMSRDEFLLRQFEKEIVPEIQAGRLRTTRDIEKAVQAMRTGIMSELETVPNLPKELEDPASLAYRKLRGQSIDIVFDRPEEEIENLRKKPYKYEKLTRLGTEEEMAMLMKQGGYYGGISPSNIAAGRRSLFDYRGLVSGAPHAYDVGRRPEQGIRQYMLAEQARQGLASEGYREFDKFATREMKEIYGEAVSPHLKTVYVNPETHAKWLESAGIGDGEALMREGLRDKLTQREVTSTHLVGIDDKTIRQIRRGEIQRGQILGMVAKTGQPFVVEDPSTIKQAIGFSSKSQGDYATIYSVNEKRLASHNKWFNDLKVLARFVDDEVLNKTSVGSSFGGADVVATTEALTKNPALHAKQMVSGMHEMMLGSAPASKSAAAFMRDPMLYMGAWDKVANAGKGYEHKAFIQRAMNFAIKHGDLSPQEFGAVFGAVPEVEGKWRGLAGSVLRQTGASAEERRAYLAAMESGVVVGRTQLTWGGPASMRGAGGMGSIEPRLFEMFEGGAFGETGKVLSKEFTDRVIYTDPQKRMLSEALTKSMSSIAGQAKRQMGEELFDVAAKDIAQVGLENQFTEFLEKGGGWLTPTKGMQEIYVPGMETLRAMQPFTTAGGKGVRGEIPSIYYGLMYRAGELAEGKIGEEAYQEQVETALESLWRESAPGGKGGGGYLRGKVAGSRFLEITSAMKTSLPMPEAHKIGTINAMGELMPRTTNEVLVSSERLKSMLGEMKGFLSPEEFEELKMAHKKTGALPGMMARHPFIGQYSAQPVTIRGIEVAKGVSRDMVAVQERSARVAFGFEGQTAQSMMMKMTPLVGMAADKDADEAALYLVSPKTGKSVLKNLQAENSAFTNAYVQHQMRLQLLKAKRSAAGSLGLSELEKMAADVSKLGVTQSYVPKLSNELSATRRAVSSYLTGQAEADARFLLEWLEQNPISAKHMSAREISQGGLAQLGTIEKALQKTDESVLIGEVENIVRENEVARRFLKEDILIKDASEVERMTGAKVGERLKSINLEQTVNNVMESRRKFQKSGQERLTQMIAGKGPKIRPVQDLPRFLNTLQQMGNHSYANVSKGAMASIDFLQAAGRTAIKHHKAIGLGFAGSIALGMILSSPRDTIGPGNALNAQADIKMNQSKVANRLKPEDVMPSGQNLGNPSVPATMHVPTARVSGPSERTRVVARSNSIVNSQKMANRIQRMTNGNRSVNLNIRDSRSQSNYFGKSGLY